MPIASLLLTAIGCVSAQSARMVVSESVVDVRAEPRTSARPGIHDPQQETQLLFAEHVTLLRRKDGWAQIEAVEQPEYTHGRRWQGYPGWVPEAALAPANKHTRAPNLVVTTKWARIWNDPFQMEPPVRRLPLGTQLWGLDIGNRLWKVELPDGASAWLEHGDAEELNTVQGLPPQQKRQRIVAVAEQFLGDPYFWGGRSPFLGSDPSRTPAKHTGSDPITGVDCSGLVNLAHRAVGVEIPRDAHEQFLRAQAVSALQAGDLIFLSARGEPKRIVHVMLYAGADEVIEGPGTGQSVRRITLAERFASSPEPIAPGAVVDEQQVYFGTFLP